MRAFVFGFVGRLIPRDGTRDGTRGESRDVEMFASHASDPTLVTAMSLVANEVILAHDRDEPGHYQTTFGADSAKRCYTLVVVPQSGGERSDATLACEDGGPPDHSLVSALEARKRSAGLVRVVFGVLASSRGAPLSARPEPEACAAWLDTLRAEFESRYSTGAYVGRTKTVGRGDSYNFEALAETLRRLASSFDDDERDSSAKGRGTSEEGQGTRSLAVVVDANTGPQTRMGPRDGRSARRDRRNNVARSTRGRRGFDPRGCHSRAKRPRAVRHRPRRAARRVRRAPGGVRGVRVPQSMMDDATLLYALE